MLLTNHTDKWRYLHFALAVVLVHADSVLNYNQDKKVQTNLLA